MVEWRCTSCNILINFFDVFWKFRNWNSESQSETNLEKQTKKQRTQRNTEQRLVGEESTSFSCCCSSMALLNFHFSTPQLHFSNSPSSLSKTPSLSLLPTCSSSYKNPSKFSIIYGTRNSGLFRVRAMTPSFGSRLEETVKKTVTDNPVVVYSKSWCSWVPHLLFLLFLCVLMLKFESFWWFGIGFFKFLMITFCVCVCLFLPKWC